jgi:hypothetical protein
MSAYSDYVLSTSPAIYVPMETNSGVALVGTNMVVSGTTTGAPLAAGFTGSVLFNPATSDRMSSVHEASVDFTGFAPYSIAFWAKPTDASFSGAQKAICFQRSPAGGRPGWGFSQGFTTGDRFALGRDNGVTEDAQEITSFFATATVVFAVAAFDGANWNVYKNGSAFSLVGSSVALASSGTDKLRIAAQEDGDFYWDGNLTQVAIWARVVTPSEVTTMWQLGNNLSPGPTPTPAPLVQRDRIRTRGTSW